MRVTAYTIDRVAGTVVFNRNNVFAAPGEQWLLPGSYTVSGDTITYNIQLLPPELGVVL